MLSSGRLKKIGLESLRGKWGTAVAVGFVASLFVGGGTLSSGGSESFTGIEEVEFLGAFLTVALVFALVSLIFGGAIQLGWCTYHTKLIKGEEAKFGTLFSHCNQLLRGFAMNFVLGLFVFLWTLLLIIPGIIAGYSYAMVPYLMAEFPDLGIMDAIRESKRLMKGNRMELFFLHLSFIGWGILCLFTLGIGYLWLTPYEKSAEAAFYMTVTGRTSTEEAEQPCEQSPLVSESRESWE